MMKSILGICAVLVIAPAVSVGAAIPDVYAWGQDVHVCGMATSNINPYTSRVEK